MQHQLLSEFRILEHVVLIVVESAGNAKLLLGLVFEG